MSKFRDENEGEITIILADVKSGKAQLTKLQRQIKKAVEEGRVRFETWKINDNKLEINGASTTN